MKQAAELAMKPLSRLRFDALAGYARSPISLMLNEELAWFQYEDERLLGVLVRHRADGDYAGLVLGRDTLNRYRAINQSTYFRKKKQAYKALERMLVAESKSGVSVFPQGDERGKALDFFSLEAQPEKIHSSFNNIATESKYSSARGLLSAMMHYFKDPDGNFVKDFQTDNFDSRLWELYLFATFAEQHYAFDREHAAPDFLCVGAYGSFFTEAVTVNPTVVDGKNIETGPPDEELERLEYLQNYVPIKYGSPLFSKLQKEYWKKPHIKGRPIVLAIQDFHYPGSMIYSEGQLAPYLYGLRQEASHGDDGKLVINAFPIIEHRWKSKSIPSGFFNQPNAEHIAAVLTNSQATISKFNRIGLKAGFGDLNLTGVRLISCWDPDPNSSEPINFMQDIHTSSYEETWSEGLNVYHNPNAVAPLPDYFLPAAVHHRLKGNLISSKGPVYRPMSSVTMYGTTTATARKIEGFDISTEFPFSKVDQSIRFIPGVSKEVYENDPNYLSDRGAIFYRAKQDSYALEDLNRAISIDSNFSTAYFNRCLVYSRKKDYISARADIQKFTSLAPKDGLAHAMLGLCHEKLKDFKAAIDSFEKSLELDPKIKETYFWRACLHQRMHDPDAALKDLTVAIELDPQYGEAYFNRAAVQQDLDNQEAAVEDLKRGLQIIPDFVRGYVEIGRSLALLDRFEEAISEATKGIKLGDCSAEAYMLRGTYYTSIGKVDLGLADLNFSIEKEANNAKPYFLKALIYDQHKRSSPEARDCYSLFLTKLTESDLCNSDNQQQKLLAEERLKVI
ncbi:MAG: tetratricopeptide repeat protein [Candidatus Melainabacteria bacterium]|nr:tetratricopeptide repeat protein [Candidatus Melainabacteria bacterium]